MELLQREGFRYRERGLRRISGLHPSILTKQRFSNQPHHLPLSRQCIRRQGTDQTETDHAKRLGPCGIDQSIPANDPFQIRRKGKQQENLHLPKGTHGEYVQLHPHQQKLVYDREV